MNELVYLKNDEAVLSNDFDNKHVDIAILDQSAKLNRLQKNTYQRLYQAFFLFVLN